ncbi:pentapeptide repeat-containing protein [Streptomyces sp. NPDC002599]|uniref:pentapeptide repeat-containing protein n=1 Tax=Streptomyces sp. NPDC002599 TaxID=3154421 RepID=UPI0033190811
MADFQKRPVTVMLWGTGTLLLIMASVVWLPRVIYPPLTTHELYAVASGKERIELQQAQAQVQNDFRGQLLQCLAGLVVTAGALAGWQQLKLAREGQVADRFGKAIDHLGSPTCDVRLGGIYALERLAKAYPADQPHITYLLGAFVRDRVAWPAGLPNGPEHPTLVVDTQLPWLSSRYPDVQTALWVLGRRDVHPDEQALYLSRLDLRRASLRGARLDKVNFRHANLASAWLVDAVLADSRLVNTDLRRANLQGASLVRADLRGAHLQDADLRRANLRGADLTGADLTGAQLDGADLADTHHDDTTVWPGQYTL